MSIRIAAIDDDLNMPAAVRDKLAGNLADPATVEGAALRQVLNARILQGAGSPLGVVSASPGTVYVDTTRALGVSVWIKNTGTGNTGWVVLEGDTGWRQVVAAGTHSRPSLSVRVRRIDSTCFVHVRETSTGQAAAGLTRLHTLGAGFQAPIGITAGGLVLSDSGAPITNCSLLISTSRYDVFVHNVPSSPVNGIISYPTTELWPTSLPGTPV